MAKSRSTIIICMLLFSFHIQAQVEWSSIGAGGGGALSTMTVVDDADNTIYVGCDVGGVFKSTDHGSTWEIKNTGISTYYIHDISYDPVNTNTLYVATRGGIFKSTNRGDNWEIKRSGFPTEGIYSYSAPISDIIIDPNNTNIIYAGMGFLHSGHIGIYESFWVNIANKGAIYKSTDYGENWSLIRETGINTEAKILSLAFDPNNSSILYAATDMGLYKSTTAGDTWSFISADLPHQYTMNILTDPNNSDILYVTLWTEPSNEWEGGVYKSTDGGINWIAKNNGLAQIVGSQEPTTSNYTTLIIDKNNTDVLYAANPCWNLGYGGVYKTIDGGDNWDWVTMPAGSNQNIGWGWLELVTIGASSLAMDPNDSDRLYFGTNMIIMKTEDGGDNWDQTYTDSTGSGYWKGRGIETTVATDIAVDPTNSDNIYLGYRDIGLLKSIDGGVSFKSAFAEVNNSVTPLLTITSIVIDPDSPNILYAASLYSSGMLYKSIDYGENWVVIDNGIPNTYIYKIALDKNSPTDSRILYVTSQGNGIYKTEDGGENWAPMNNGLGVDGNLNASSMIIDPNNSDILYAGFHEENTYGGSSETKQGGLFKSTNAGLSWTRMDNDLVQFRVSDIDIVSNNSQVIYTSVSGGYDHSIGITFSGGVYKSTDGGNSWSNMDNGFGTPFNLKMSSVAISPVDSNTLYAATNDAPYHDNASGLGIFKSVNGGENWETINEGLGLLRFNNLTINPQNPQVLYASSNGAGVFKGVDTDIVAVDDFFENIEYKIYPNPSNGFITISGGGENEIQNLEFININGQIVLPNMSINKVIDLSFLSNGVYFLRLDTSDGIIIKKIILMD